MTDPVKLTRRQAIIAGLWSGGAIGLRALATGIPPALLLSGTRQAWSQAACNTSGNPQYLLWVTSGSGDSFNCNAPGTYPQTSLNAGAGLPSGDVPTNYPFDHSTDPTMAPTAVAIGGKSYTVATPWAQLGSPSLQQNYFERATFIHAATLTANHGDELRVLKLMGQLRRNEMLMSYIAQNLKACLGTVQAEPLVLGPEAISYQGKYLPRLTPTGLRNLLIPPEGLDKTLQQIRDTELDKVNALLKGTHATSAEQTYLDSMVTSQSQLRQLGQSLANDLADLTTDGDADQALAAAILFKAGVAPAASIHLSFGGDNHYDKELVTETLQTAASFSALQALLARLEKFGLQDKVTIICQNVFGRTLVNAGMERQGRAHNPVHHVTMLIGKAIRGSVIGGLTQSGQALDIDSTTGAGRAAGSGDIARIDSLASVGLTLGRAVGLPDAVMKDPIFGIASGKVITAALA